MAFSLGGSWNGSWSGASDSGLGNWSTMGGGNKSSGGAMFDPISLGVMAAGQLGSAIFTGQANQRVAEKQKQQAKDQALYGMLGTMQAANDARASRDVASAMNVFGQLGGSLFGAPIEYGLQRRARREGLEYDMPMQFAMQRQEKRLGEEEEQTPLFRGGRQKEAYENRLAGRYAAALPAMTKWGQFNLPTA
jgi:hypothetical protein